MAAFPSTTEELEQLISDYMTAHIAERVSEITAEQVGQAVSQYMQDYGAAMEDNGVDGDVPMIADDALDPDNTTIPLARLSNGVPTSYFQARVRALARAAANYITQADVRTPIVLHYSSETIATISPNVLHVWFSSPSLTVFFGAGTQNVVNEYMLQFMVDGNGFSLSLPSGVLWMNDEEPEWEDGCTYQVSIVNKLAIAAKWEGEADTDSGPVEPAEQIRLRTTGRTINVQGYEFICVQTTDADSGESVLRPRMA